MTNEPCKNQRLRHTEAYILKITSYYIHVFNIVGILNVKSHCVVGNGVVVHLRGLLNELKSLREADIDYAGEVTGWDGMKGDGIRGVGCDVKVWDRMG